MLTLYKYRTFSGFKPHFSGREDLQLEKVSSGTNLPPSAQENRHLAAINCNKTNYTLQRNFNAKALRRKDL